MQHYFTLLEKRIGTRAGKKPEKRFAGFIIHNNVMKCIAPKVNL